MKTPDAVEAAKRARAEGTMLAVVEFLCRTRFKFTLRALVAECPRLGVEVPQTIPEIDAVLAEARKRKLCELSVSGMIVSLVAGQPWPE